MAIGSDPLALLPWTAPFRMVDRMIECVPHSRVVTLRRLSAGDALFEGADPESVAFPSVLVLEGLNQSAALLFRLSYGDDAAGGLPMLGHLAASVHGAARPGDTLEFTVTAVKMTRRGGIFSGSARVDGKIIAESEMGFGMGAP